MNKILELQKGQPLCPRTGREESTAWSVPEAPKATAAVSLVRDVTDWKARDIFSEFGVWLLGLGLRTSGSSTLPFGAGDL